MKNSLRPIHTYSSVPKRLRDGFQNREQARFKELKNEPADIMRLADEWTTIPDHFQPMKLYSFMSVSEQDAFWTRRFNDHKWEWLNHLHRCVPLPELFALLDHQLLFQFVQVCKSYENNINCKISLSNWLMAVPEAKHTKAKALVRAQQDFGPNSERHTRVFKNSLADYLERPDAIPSDAIATRIPISESIMSNEQGMAPP